MRMLAAQKIMHNLEYLITIVKKLIKDIVVLKMKKDLLIYFVILNQVEIYIIYYLLFI